MTVRKLPLVVLAIFFAGISTRVLAEDVNALTDEERSQGFELLFDGTSLDGWKQSGNWEIVDGAIARTDRGGSLVYAVKKVPDDFELRFQWKVAKGSNSGVYYRPGQYEYQILHNQGHSNGTNPRTTAASLYFCMAPSRDATRPAGQWNTGRIVCQGSVIQHWLNGEKVVDFDYSDPQWKANVDLLDKRGGKLTARGAFLSLQDHGDPVWFRAIKLRQLKASDDIGHQTVMPAKIPQKELDAEQKKLRGILDRRKKQ